MLRNVPPIFAHFGHIGTPLDLWSRRDIHSIFICPRSSKARSCAFVFLSRESLSWISGICVLSCTLPALNDDNLVVLSAQWRRWWWRRWRQVQWRSYNAIRSNWRNQCTSGDRTAGNAGNLAVCRHIRGRISVSNHDCRYRRYPGPCYSRSSSNWVIGYLCTSTLTIGPSDALSRRVSSKIMWISIICYQRSRELSSLHYRILPWTVRKKMRVKNLSPR